MKKSVLFLTLILLSVFLLTGCTNNTVVNQNNNQPLLGGDKDEHGCIGSAGYSWCEAKQKCLRIWEEKCEEEKPVHALNDIDFYTCQQDNDCININYEYCDCNSDGKATAINKKYEKEWLEIIRNKTVGTGCYTAMSKHPTCFAEAKCIDRKCELVTKSNKILSDACRQIVKGEGICEAYFLGYEVNSSSGKCEKRGVSGCNFTTPFNSLEECQKACED